MNSKSLMALAASAFFALVAPAQGTDEGEQGAYGALFSQSVKSCDEFMCRFNEEELFPGLDLDDPKLSEKNFILLFDYKLSERMGRDSFYAEAIRMHDEVRANNVKLRYESKEWYAEVRAEFVYNKRETVELGLVLQTEITPKNLPCWTIVGVNGLEKLGYADSTNRLVIGPAQHEAGFVEIDSDFKYSSSEFSRFRGYGVRLDALSYFFALVESGNLEFKGRISTRFHFFDVPSYVFSVMYHGRSKSNTGWLITDCRKTNDESKAILLNQLLGR